MEEETVQVIRGSTRSFLQFSRQQQRDDMSDLSRRMCVMSTAPENLTDIAQKLKTKSSISLLELEILKNGLMDDRDNMKIVLSTHGAIRGLVRELTGHNVKKQSAALACLCNLALADAKACKVIAKASGPYLIATLDNLSTELATTCAWTLGNLAGSSAAVCELLIIQGALTKLSALLQSSNEELLSAVIYALEHFAYQLKDNLSSEHLALLLQLLTKNSITIWTSRVLFTLSCHKHFLDNVPEDLSQKVLEEIPPTMKSHSLHCRDHDGKGFCCKLIYLLRILANMDTTKIYRAVLDFFVDHNLSDQFHELFNFDNKVVSDSLFWLLGNLYNYNSAHLFFQSFLNQTCSDESTPM